MGSDPTDTNNQPSRRELAAGAALLLAMGLAPAAAAAPPRRAVPKGFLWGTAISGHQSEGNNVNADAWYLENHQPTAFAEPSGDACDSYHRYAEDLDIAASLGLNCYRFGIEWSRIEPAPGRFSIAELDRYARVLEACHRRGLMPMVTFNHFTVPLGFAERGGFEVAETADLFARFAERTTAHLGPLIGMASTFNEANIVLLRKVVPRFPNATAAANARAMIRTAAERTGSPAFSSMLFGDPDRISEVMLDAHAKAYAAMKAGPGDFPVGVTLSMQQVDGSAELVKRYEDVMYGGWIEASRRSDFIGVQTYSRLFVGDEGMLPYPKGTRLTDAGYEYYPAAIGHTIRYAHEHIGRPVYLTETGIATENDAERVSFIDETIAEVRRCIAEGIDVKGYIYWSLLDNFEWVQGYAKHFGLVDVDRTTFRRTPKPSARHLGTYARRGRL